MAWIYLIIAGLLEVGWALGLKIAQNSAMREAGWGLAVLCIFGSGFFLWLAQKHIPMGTAYAVWTGMGVLGTFWIGVLFFEDQLNFMRIISILLILLGIIGLKLAD
jgi:quaternary ammonium compound-resistance protein SugE